MTDEELYSRFSQYYIEMLDNLNGLAAEIEELMEDSQPVPSRLVSEHLRHAMIVDILTQVGKEKYNKEPKELYKDGWEFWFKEDAEIRRKKAENREKQSGKQK